MISKTAKFTATPIYAAIITFLTYAMVYGFRKPFTVATYEEVSPVWGVAYKSCLVISQVLGYMFSKFYGVKFIAELKRFGRGKMILVLVSVSWVHCCSSPLCLHRTILPFCFERVSPGPDLGNCVFICRGPKGYRFYWASLAVSFIFSSGFVKTVTGFLQTESSWYDSWFTFFCRLVF